MSFLPIKITKRKRPDKTEGPETQDKKTKIQRRWNTNETSNILAYLKDSIQRGKAVEKPTAEDYYRKMLPKLCIADCTVSQLKNKVKNMRESYTKTVQWRNQTGQGVLEDEGLDSFERVTLTRCPFFKELDEIFGTKLNINPPFVIDTDLLEYDVATDNAESNQQNSAAGSNDLEILEEETNLVTSPNLPNSNSKDLKQSRQPSQGSSQGGLKALFELRNEKLLYDNKKVEVEMQKLDFEREKFEFEKESRRRQLNLEEQKAENENTNARFEIEMKYKTQLEIAKLASIQKKT